MILIDKNLLHLESYFFKKFKLHNIIVCYKRGPYITEIPNYILHINALVGIMGNFIWYIIKLVAPHQTYNKRLYLNDPFITSNPSSYRVLASRTVVIFATTPLTSPHLATKHSTLQT